MKSYKKNVLGVFTLFIMILFSSIVKLNDVKNNSGIENIEASYHSLLIAKSISERSFKEHHFLPIVTLGGDINSNIPWGASVPDRSGGYIYTSFPSVGFLAPELFIRAFNLDYSIKSIVYFNLIILILTSLTFYTFIIKTFKPTHYYGFLISALSCAPLILSRESLASSGILYWPQSLSQLFISVFILSVAIRINNKSRASLIFVFASLLLLSLTEWTGFVLGGLSLLYFILSKENRDIRLSACITASLIASLFIFGVQLLLTLDFSAFTSASVARFSVRSGENANFADLILGYYESFSLFLIIIPIYIAHNFISKKKPSNLIIIALLLSVFMLIENIILAQHASSYTFDRFKMAFLLSVMIAELLFSDIKYFKAASLMAVLISIALSKMNYTRDVGEFKKWSSIQNSNSELVSRIKAVSGFECARIFNSTRVRAYLNLSLDRSVWEYIPSESDLRSSTDKKCPVIIINGDIPFKDLQKINYVDVYRGGALDEVIK